MGVLTPMPSVVRKHFKELYNNSPKFATDYFYELNKACNYIRCDRIEKDQKWKYNSEYGTIDITINLSKPEKDPKDIIKQGQMRQVVIQSAFCVRKMKVMPVRCHILQDRI